MSMLLIGENIHIISKTVREALVNEDRDFILNLLSAQKNMDYVDLNVGPAKRELAGTLPWLINLVNENTSLKVSLDTTNFEEMKNSLSLVKDPKNAILNSTSDDAEKLDSMTDLAAEYHSNLVCLTFKGSSGIPKTADERMELALDIYETAMAKGIENEKLFFDPLILPICVDQAQAYEALTTIKILKESFEPKVMTTIGLSNISNGCPKELRPLINKVFMAFAIGAGLDSAIVDAKDLELIDTVKMIETNSPKTKSDKLLVDLKTIMSEFGELEDIKFDNNDENSLKIYKTAKIILNKEIYSNSFTQV